MKKIPLSIDPNPVVEATVELKFQSSLPRGAVFGVLYTKFQQKYPISTALPILNIPEDVRASDPSFNFQALYKLSNDKYDLQIGNDVISIHSNKGYVGWNNFSTELDMFFETLTGSGVIQSPVSLVIRYLNFFPDMDIFPDIDVEVRMANSAFVSPNLLIRSEKEVEGLTEVLQITNNATLLSGPNTSFTGSLMDISVFENKVEGLNNFKETVEKLHTREKRIFFNLLKTRFVENLNPVYP
ncbi:TIGR04255 family protein [Dyadobacter soli]|uniref:TIGR04255 family protein n=1 Tax=Dyadobacter soli TaxID=659014 RepID=A0A1G7WHS7_9BACT|nr:TIGR04255 family protein [Dyadobacter soli]SDG71424.1 TIGR04255 family protein [Dyadobacter soli]